MGAGIYEVTIFSLDDLVVLGTSYSLEVDVGPVDAKSSFAYGPGLSYGKSGVQNFFMIQTRDSYQMSVQVISTRCDLPEVRTEKQKINIESKPGNNLTLSFRGKRTSEINVGLSTLMDLQLSLESIPTISTVSITSDGSSVFL